jgi:TonB family protein
VAAPVLSADDQQSRRGYAAAILASALGHAVLLYLAIFVLPRFLTSRKAPPPAYTVKIVDRIPAGDLGTHLPRLGPVPKAPPHHQPPPEAAKPKPAPTPPPPDNDKNAIALNTSPTRTPTPTPTPPSAPTPAMTPAATPIATPKPRKREHRARPTPTPAPAPTPRAERHRPRPEPTIARAESTPDIKAQMQKVRENLMREHLKAVAAEKNAARENSHSGGPALASADTPGKGMGVGGGEGSLGIQQDPEFLLYYQTVQDKIKKAWAFAGSNPELTAIVTFGINPDGTLNSVKVTTSSSDPSFDDSVVRAIRRAAPFGAPPEKYRDQFGRGVEAEFKLGEMES